MKVNGLDVNTQAIAEGLYRLICARGEEAIVAFGMIPKWIMDITDKLLREKVVTAAAKQVKATYEEYLPYVDEQKLNDTVQPIINEVCIGIYTAAGNSNKMLV